ncbi:arabinofuranosidase [Dendrothele bispora CBS 962.96]|uniref:non-reducing end alpha-L-arabinofuranosidase n=1 Tax=Dendrothele bispora (strain CBS 962.96) TaxID=1314807 RepID=A0A4V4HEP8_DENBC|nr:arabinofuranosidase [Dendrothele bispora CBS 962.96]
MLRSIFLVTLVVFGFVGAQTTVTVSSTASHPIPTTLWGQMFEDISSGDGGLYGELLQNRAFQQVTPGTSAALNAWQAVNRASVSVVADSVKLSNALPNALRVQIPTGVSGQTGVANTGYFGIRVNSAWTYTASFFYRFPTASSFRGNAVISLQTSSSQVLGSATVALSGAQTSWTQVTAKITPTSSPSATDNLFVVSVDGAAASGQTINFGLFSLFPPTFKNRANGMRMDVAEALAEMQPSFFRFPGGNNLEGNSLPSRWQWNNTVGPLTQRPGRAGTWGYINTDGLGLYEYLLWCEDVGMEPIMAVWDGFDLGGSSVAEANLQPYIQQAIDQINFVIGNPTTSAPAAMRSSLGHPAPFKLTHVEIGNEDFIGNAPSTIAYRWNHFASTLRSTFPQLRFLATSNVNSPRLTPQPQEWDLHVYQTPTWFAQNSFMYDDFARDGTLYFEGEYAAISTNPNDIFGSPSDGRLTFPTVQSAVGEAAFMTGLERNSDIVFAASYAPLLNHVANSQWTPNLVSFDSANVYRSTSFYVQKLFSLNRGDQYIPSTLPSRTGTLFWSVVSKQTNTIIIKVVNVATSAQTIAFNLPFSGISTTGTAQVLTGAATASNSPTTPNAVAPASHSIPVGKTFSYSAPANSLSVLTLGINGSSGR